MEKRMLAWSQVVLRYRQRWKSISIHLSIQIGYV
jgi:hypothetical protein